MSMEIIIRVAFKLYYNFLVAIAEQTLLEVRRSFEFLTILASVFGDDAAFTWDGLSARGE